MSIIFMGKIVMWRFRSDKSTHDFPGKFIFQESRGFLENFKYRWFSAHMC